LKAAVWGSCGLRQEVTCVVHDLSDRSVVVFDDERVVANAGVMLPALLARRLGIEALVDARVDLGERAGAANAGRKVMTMISAMALGADCIEDCEILRSGQTAAVLGHPRRGAVDAGDVPARVYVRACPPA
jgi:hypothetical protein